MSDVPSSDLLNLTEYQALADNLVLPQASFIDGAYHTGSGAPLSTTNPATGDVLATFAMADSSDVDLAVRKAREAFDNGKWSNTHQLNAKQR